MNFDQGEPATQVPATAISPLAWRQLWMVWALSAMARTRAMNTSFCSKCRAALLARLIEEFPNMKSHILKWKHGKTAPFLHAFDDNAPTQLDILIPEQQKRQMVGDFYIIPGGERFQEQQAEWEIAAQSPFVVLANHTFTHAGATSAAQLEPELARCSDAIRALTPAQKWPRILGFGRPGGVPWTISDEENDRLLNQFHLAQRPRFRNPHKPEKSTAQTTTELLAIVDEALRDGEVGQIGFHGVGGDWLLTPLECFHALLDKLEAHREEIWFTDAASWHKYQTERDAAKLKILQEDEQQIRLQLCCETDSIFYDLPLSVEIEVPQNWTKCVVRQGASEFGGVAQKGTLRLEMSPVPGEFVLTPAI
ncbi:MAG: polysaccharide deacetylase family protein [Armatimonadetes bacterium]|nr:polysaccharide deacetylase family protein [Armatimonadota bacterium]